MIKDLVTILTPAYNSERFIYRLLDSVLLQTYPYIHMIVINDGSNDHTASVVESYKEKFEKQSKKLTVVSQQNGGVSLTINNGLKLVDGEYLVWPDSDDWFASPLSIEKLVSALKSHGDEVGVALCAYNRVKEADLSVIRVDYPCLGKTPQNVFESSVKGSSNLWLSPGGYMIKTKFLDELIPGREIYNSRLTGQNTQILWPYLYAKKLVSVEEPLFSYLVRENSHSRGLYANLDKKIRQQDEYIKTFETVLFSIKGLDERKAKELLRNRYETALSTQIFSCEQANAWNKAHHYYRKMFSLKKAYNEKKGIHLALKYIFSYIPILREVVRDRIKLMSKLKTRSFGLLSLLAISVLINMSIAFICISPKVMRKYYEFNFTPIANNPSLMESQMKDACLKMLKDEVATDESVIYYNTIPEYLHHIVQGRKLYSVFQYGEFGYFLHYLFLYAQNTKDETLMREVKRQVDKGLLKGQNSLQIVRNDQCSYGCILLDLYQQYKEDKYKQIAKSIVARLDSIDKKDGIVRYRETSHKQDVDCIGLVCPFLNQYAQTFSDSHVDSLSAKMINDYSRYGMDYLTGLPCQAYDTKTAIKTLNADWGRGCGWFCLGVSTMNKSLQDSLCRHNISKLDSTLVSLSPLYNQFVGQGDASKPDMSATVFITYYLQAKGIYGGGKNQFLKTLRPYTDEDGFIRYNSPSISRQGEAPNAFQKHHVGQAVALYLLSVLK